MFSRAALPLALSAALACGGAHEAAPSDTRDTQEAGLASCIDGDTSAQRRGTACLCCHAGEFGAAGTVDLGRAPAKVAILDATGRTVSLDPNPFGNFFSHERLVPPLRPLAFDDAGRAVAMQAPAPTGDCNSCHGAAGAAPAIFAPRAEE